MLLYIPLGTNALSYFRSAWGCHSFSHLSTDLNDFMVGSQLSVERALESKHSGFQKLPVRSLGIWAWAATPTFLFLGQLALLSGPALRSTQP